MADILIFLCCLISGIILTSISVYYIVCLSDIMFDFVSIEKGCDKMNRLVLLEAFLITFIPLSFFYYSNWIFSTAILPLTLHTILGYIMTPGFPMKYVPDNIRGGAGIKRYSREAYIKIILHLFISLTTLYYLIVSALS